MIMGRDEVKFVCIAVLDGWGIAPEGPGNAISLAKTPNMDRLVASYPHTQLEASGEAVGLPRGEVGNTEVGHLNIGAGRIVYQDLPRINMAISSGTFFENKVLVGAIEHARRNNSKLHLMGLVGAGGVHSNMEHLFALLHLAKIHGAGQVYVHVFTDGRDSPTTSSQTYIAQLREQMNKEGVGTIASIMGRFWAMDRDRRWERTGKAYLALTQGQGNLVKTPEEAIEVSYSLGKTDEFIEPSIIVDNTGKPIGLIEDNDGIIFYNFRIDRPRQLSRVFLLDDFVSVGTDFDPYQVRYEKKHITVQRAPQVSPFDRGEKLKNIYFAMMTEYEHTLVEAGAHVAFPKEIVEMPIGRVISEIGQNQLRVAESEKERFVTYYFDGQREHSFPGSEKLIIPSPKVATYDLKPEMSAFEITNSLLESVKKSMAYKLVLINFANPDMVGHTGSIGAAVKACEVVDECVGRLYTFTVAYGGALIVTGDHGNVEELINPKTNEINTEHTANPVPYILASKKYIGNPRMLKSGILADIAPTALKLLGINPPGSMTGKLLLP